MKKGDPVARRKVGATTLDLYLSARRDGYNFEWQDGHGQSWCSGWFAGSKDEVTEQAVSVLELTGMTGP